jgi:hypothetical protein
MNICLVTLTYKGSSDENRRGHTLRGPCFSSIHYYGCKILRYCCYSSPKRITLSRPATSYSHCCLLHDQDVKNCNYAESYDDKGVEEENKNAMAFSLKSTHISLAKQQRNVLGKVTAAHVVGGRRQARKLCLQQSLCRQLPSSSSIILI